MSVGLQIVVCAVIGVALLTVIIAIFRAKKPLRLIVSSLTEGVCALAAVNIVGVFTGVSLGFGWFSIGCCAAFGVPGVISMLLMRMITLL